MISPALYAGVLTLVMGATPMTSPSRVAMTHAATPVTTVASVDLDRYAGEWFEIARFPNRFQEKCAGEVKAVYARRPDGRVDVTNTCRTSDGATTAARGVARVVDQATRSKLKVRFAPAVLSFLPFVWGDYWILELASDYSHAVVGEPDRKYLWVLARSPKMDDSTLAGILERVKQQGYDVSALIRTEHTR
jgi:apolipoprotein D and lipocalin family protein